MTEITPAEAVYFTAVALPPTERAAYLDRACAGNDELRHRVERMLAAKSEVGDFLEPEPQRASPADGATGTFDEGRPAGGAASLSVGGLAIPGYRIEDPQPLGSGGMGVVYRATQTALNREVALKMLLGGLFASPTLRARFLVEAESAAALEHPHIVRVFEFGEVGGYPYLAMEFVPGGTLSARLKATGPLPPADAAELVAKLAGAVAHAHSRGVVHRDIKSPNVLLTTEGEPRLTDFGLAKVGRMARDLSVTGQVLGTPGYMPPEQAAGKVREVGTAADVYGLGAVLYDVLTGRPPFQGDSAAVTLQKVLTEEPQRPRALNPSVPRDLETICLKCLKKDPARRYGSAAEFGADLCAYLDGRPIAARPTTGAERTWKWVRRNPVVAGSGLAVAGSLLLGTTVSYLYYLDARTQGALATNRAADAKRDAEFAQGETARAEAAATALADQLKETRRVLDLSKLREAQAAFDRTLARRARDTLAEIAPENRCGVWGILARRFEGSLFTLYGHTNGVSSVAVSADGSRIVTGSSDHTARVWDARTGQPLLVLDGHKAPVTSVAVSADGSRIVTGSQDHTARVWDARTGRFLFELALHGGSVGVSVAVSADGSRIVTAAADINDVLRKDYTARVWDGTGKELLVLQGHERAVNRVILSADGSRVVTGAGDSVRVWDARTGRSLVELKGRLGGVNSVALSPDGSRIVTGSGGPEARVWDTRTGQVLFELKGHAGSERFLSHVRDVAYSPDGSRIVTGADDTTARVWDARTGQFLFELKGHEGSVSAVAFTPDGTRVVTGSGDQTARVWDAKTGQPALELDGPGQTIGLALSADGTRVVTGSEDGTAQVWDAATGALCFELKGPMVCRVAVSADGSRIVTGALGFGRDPGAPEPTAQVRDGRTGNVLFELPGHTHGVGSVGISADGSRVVTLSRAGRARVWDGKTGIVLFELKGQKGSVSGVTISADGSRIVTVSADAGPRVWDGHTGQVLRDLEGREGEGDQVALSADGSRAVALFGGAARVWDTRTGTPVVDLKGHAGGVSCAAWNGDGTLIVTGSEDGTARVWDVRTGQPLLELKGTGPDVTHVAISADGSRIVVGSGYGNTRVWDARPGRPLLELNGHAGDVTAVAVSADGSRVVSGSDDQTARVWDARTGQFLYELTGHTAAVSCAAVSADGTLIVTGAHDGTVRVWNGTTVRSVFEVREEGQIGYVSSVALAADGSQIVARYGPREQTMVWDLTTGRPVPGAPVPALAPNRSRTSDDAFVFLPVRDRIIRVPARLDEDERRRRLWLTRPDPAWHDLRAALLKRGNSSGKEVNDYGAALNYSLKIRARGILALEAGDADRARAYFNTAEALKPPIPSAAEAIPPPVLMPPAQ
jgi:eukaryotic-like serine/threonine-protein kinase